MSYDGLERLTAVSTTNAESFTLDGASNITARTGPAATYTIDDANRPTSDGTNTLTWSDADRLTGRGSDSFSYDALERLTGSTVAGTSRSYAYDGDGMLSSRTTGGSSVDFLWDPATSPQRLLVSGSDLIVYGLGPLYRVNGTTVTTFARDGQKSIRAELQGSTVTGSWRYRAYGEIAQSSGASTPAILGYAGQLLDPSALYYMRARWYDAAIGRFITRDPLSAGTSAVNGINAFGYAGGNPVSSLDPSGLMATSGDNEDGGHCDADCVELIWLSSQSYATTAAPARDLSFVLPDYVRASVAIDPFHLGWAASFTVALDRYGGVYISPVGLFTQPPNVGKSTLPAGVTLTVGWIAAAGKPTESTVAGFLQGPSYSICAAAGPAVCFTESPGGPGISKFAAEGGVGTLDASFVGGVTQRVYQLPIGW